MQLEGFSRIDAFVNVDNGEVQWFYDAKNTFPFVVCWISKRARFKLLPFFFKAFSCELCALSCEWFRFSQFIYGHPIHLLLLSMNNLFTYCQFHIFQVLIIEVNTVPGMTPSTVLIHQVITNSQIHILFQQLRLFWCPMEIWLS